MADPGACGAGSHAASLDAYREIGGNCAHLHAEGGEQQSRSATGAWLSERRARQQFHLVTQICHDGWDDRAQQPVDRFTSDAVKEDADTDLDLLRTDYLDLAYLDDRADLPLEPVLLAVFDQIRSGRVRAYGLRNCAPARVREATALARSCASPTPAAVVTTELSLLIPSRPLWPGYIPFDSELAETVSNAAMGVLAHASDINIGQCVFGDEEAFARARPEWVSRWPRGDNAGLASRIQRLAGQRGATPREVSVSWMLSRSYPVIAIVSLPALLGESKPAYAQASQWVLSVADQEYLSGSPVPGSLR